MAGLAFIAAAACPCCGATPAVEAAAEAAAEAAVEAAIEAAAAAFLLAVIASGIAGFLPSAAPADTGSFVNNALDETPLLIQIWYHVHGRQEWVKYLETTCCISHSGYQEPTGGLMPDRSSGCADANPCVCPDRPNASRNRIKSPRCVRTTWAKTVSRDTC